MSILTYEALFSPICSNKENIKGVQIAPLVACDVVEGAQFGVLSLSEKVQGLSVGIFNSCEEINGVQIGMQNIGYDVRGVQAGLLCTGPKGYTHAKGPQPYWAESGKTLDVVGMQIGGMVAVAEKVRGVQAGTVALAEEIQGVQIGVFCMADNPTSKGVQIGGLLYAPKNHWWNPSLGIQVLDGKVGKKEILPTFNRITRELSDLFSS